MFQPPAQIGLLHFLIPGDGVGRTVTDQDPVFEHGDRVRNGS